MTDKQTDLRDRVAAAIWERQNPGRRWVDCEYRWRADAEADADAVLAVLPPPADRPAVLLEAAEVSARFVSDCQTCAVELEVARELRRLAAEAQQQPELQADPQLVSEEFLQHLATAKVREDDGAEAQQPYTDGAGEPAELRTLPREVRRLVHAVDRMRSDWAEAPEHGPERRELWTEVHSACDAVWDRIDTAVPQEPAADGSGEEAGVVRCGRAILSRPHEPHGDCPGFSFTEEP